MWAAPKKNNDYYKERIGESKYYTKIKKIIMRKI